MRLKPFNKEKALKKLKSNPSKRLAISSIGILLLTILIIQSYALFKLNDKHNIVEGTVGEFSNADVRIMAIYIDEVKTDTFPAKDSKVYQKTECNNDAQAVWNKKLWSLKIENVTEITECNVYFTSVETNYVNAGLMFRYDAYTIPEGNTIQDLSGNNNDATATNFDIGSGWSENAIYLDGVNDSINVGFKNYDFGNQITLSIRFKIMKPKAQHIFNNFEGSGFGFIIRDTNIISSYFYSMETSSYIFCDSTMKIIPNKYYTVTLTNDGNNIKLYINGELHKTTAFSGNIKVSTAPMTIGADPTSNIEYYGSFSNMSFKSAMLYGRALTIEEIKQNYQKDLELFG